MTARSALGRPVAIVAIAVLALNDHVLKAWAPGLVTGKLSDIAGMVCFPLLVAFVIDRVRGRETPSTIVGAVVATGVVFAAVKLFGPAADAYRTGLGLAQWPFRAVAALVAHHPVPPLAAVQLTQDPTDLIALVALGVPLRLAGRDQPEG